MNQLDRHLDRRFAALGDRVDRGALFKRAGIITASALGFGVAVEEAGAVPSKCANNFGRCNGCLCCGDYNGCKPETPYYCGYTPAGCYKTTDWWGACCNSYWRYEWWDCCFRVSGSGGPCGAGGSPSNCTSGSGCDSYCGSGYRCTFRVIVANGC